MTGRVALAVVAGLVAGSALGAFAHAPPNDRCQPRWEVGGSATWTVERIPLGARCELVSPDGMTTADRYVPSVGEWLAWVVLSSLVVGLALRDRRSAALRGAVGALAVLSVLGVAWLGVEFTGVVMAGIVVGTPLVLVLDLALSPRDQRSAAASLTLAALVTGAVIVASMLPSLLGVPGLGVLAGVLVGAGVSMGVARLARGLAATPLR